MSYPELTQTSLQELSSSLERLFLQGTLLSRIGTNALVSVSSNSTPKHDVTQLSNRILSSQSSSIALLVTGVSASGKSELCNALLQTFQCSHTYAHALLDTFTHSITPHSYNATRAIKLAAFHLDSTGVIRGYEIIRHLLLDRFRVTSRVGFSFHCFYLLAKGAPIETQSELFISEIRGKYLDPVSDCSGADIDAKKGYEMMMKVFKECELSCDVIASILELLSAILLVGDLEFSETGLTTCEVSNQEQLTNIATLLGAQKDKLGDALTHVTLQTKTGGQIRNSLTADQSRVACDTLSRELYGRLIEWIIGLVNRRGNEKSKCVKVLNILEVPGFENGTENNFEALMINFAFEKINNMMTSFLIRERQLELAKEGISKVSVEPFDNFNLCQLLVDNFRGILPIIDSTCGQTTADPKAIIKNLNSNCGSSHLFASGIAIGVRTSGNCFRIQHHLGFVTYDVTSFKQRNIDRSSVNLIDMLSECQHPCLIGKFNRRDKLRSVIRQTREVVNEIIISLKGSEFFSLYCLNSNPSLEIGIFDRKYVSEQTKYFNLTELIKLVKIGFTFSENISDFLEKYRSIAGFYKNERPGQACRRILLGFSIAETEYLIGATKIFFSSSDTLDILEQVREISLSRSACVIQSYTRAWITRARFKKIRESQIVIASNFRAYRERKHFLSLRSAADIICKYVRGYQTRNWYYWVQEEREILWAVTVIASFYRGWKVRTKYKFRFTGNAKVLIQRFFLNFCRYLYLRRLARSLPSLSPVRFDWPDCPSFLKETSDILFKLFHSWRCELYRGMLFKNPGLLQSMKEKLLANNLFRRKKASYPKSIPFHFQGDRLGLSSNSKWKRVALQTGGFTPIVWDSNVLKVNRTNGKFQERILVVTRQDVLLIDPANFKLLQQFTLHTLKQISVSTYSDGCFVLHLSSLPTIGKPTNTKGDLVFMCPYLVELVAKTAIAVRELTNRNLPVLIRNEIEITGREGEKLIIEFQYLKGGQFVTHPKRHGNRLIFTL